MRCPFCKKDNDRVIDSRAVEDGKAVRRRRQCLECKRRFTTYEYVEEVTLYVIKKDGRREPFDREKIRHGLNLACTKRPIATEAIEEVLATIERELYDKGDREVRSSVIGDLIMKHLQKLDYVAYVRFASVYREFKDVKELKEFIKELRPLLK
jgi:transcriptional repressor NrdR